MPPASRHNPQRVKSSDSLYSLREFLAEFPDDEACLQYLWRERFSSDGTHAHCPKCDQAREFKRYKTKQQRQSWTCLGCGHHVHPTAGTIFAKSSRPLTEWFYAMFLVSSSRCGIAAKQLERELGCNYKTAHRMLRLIRTELMKQGDGSPLSGTVEADEAYIGGRRKAGTRPRDGSPASPSSKAPVFAMVERRGRVIARHVPKLNQESVLPSLDTYVMPGSLVYTDEWSVFGDLNRCGYTHKRVKHGARVYVDGDVHTNTIEGFFGIVKNGIRGTYHSVSTRWLQGYLNEYAWRYNHRDDDEAMFRQLLSSAACA